MILTAVFMRAPILAFAIGMRIGKQRSRILAAVLALLAVGALIYGVVRGDFGAPLFTALGFAFAATGIAGPTLVERLALALTISAAATIAAWVASFGTIFWYLCVYGRLCT